MRNVRGAAEIISASNASRGKENKTIFTKREVLHASKKKPRPFDRGLVTMLPELRRPRPVQDGTRA